MTRLLFLAVFAASSANILLTTGLGLRWVVSKRGALRSSLAFLLAVMLLHVLFTFVLDRFLAPSFAAFLLFPLSALFPWALDTLIGFIHPVPGKTGSDAAPDANDALCAAAAWIILQIASSAAEAFALALGFSAGLLFAYFIVQETGRRSLLEKVPAFLRGKPLALITLGLLGLVLSSVGMIVIVNR